MVSPSSMQACTTPAISASLSGVSTTNGYSTRQSVASVTCDTRDRPSNLMLSLAVRLPQQLARALAQVPHGAKVLGKAPHRGVRLVEQLADEGIARGRQALRIGRRNHAGHRSAAPFDLVQAVLERLDQQRAALRVVEQVVFEVGVALHHPDVAEHFVQHARRAAGATLPTQRVEQFPRARPEQAQHDLAVGERGVVVRNLAQARRVACGLTWRELRPPGQARSGAVRSCRYRRDTHGA